MPDRISPRARGVDRGALWPLRSPLRRVAYLIEEATLAPPRTVRVGYVPDWIALDQTTRHVFVVNGNTDSDGNPRLVGSQFQHGSVTMIDLSHL